MGCGGGWGGHWIRNQGLSLCSPSGLSPGRSCPPCSVPAPSLGTDRATPGHLQPRGPGSLHTAGGSVPVVSAPPSSALSPSTRTGDAKSVLYLSPRTTPHTHTPECSPRSLEERRGRPGNPLPRPGCCVH